MKIQSNNENVIINADGVGSDIEFQIDGVTQASLNNIDYLARAERKNYLINGNFLIAQEGTIFNNATSTYIMDMWKVFRNGSGGTLNITRNNFVAGQTDVPHNPKNYITLDKTVSGSGETFSVLSIPIEDVNTLSGETVTISFYSKSSTLHSLSYALNQQFGSGGSTAVFSSSNTTGSMTGAWAKHTFTVTVPSIAGKTVGAGSHLDLEISLPLNQTFTIDIAQVQIERGSVATDFEYRHISEELSMCRYYFRRISATTQFHAFAQGRVDGANDVQCVSDYWYGMRSVPAFSSSGSFLVEYDASSSTTPSALSFVDGRIIAPTTLATAGSIAFVRANNDINAYLDFDARF